jgi:hypothetical protein
MSFYDFITPMKKIEKLLSKNKVNYDQIIKAYLPIIPLSAAGLAWSPFSLKILDKYNKEQSIKEIRIKSYSEFEKKHRVSE